ncbi:MAG TPA: hypothetical protein ACFYD4_15600, partial [Candidatus Wunengus sp. YC61]
VILHQGDGLTIALDLYRKIKGISTSLFFLDGDHAYRSIKRELSGIIKYAPSASILVHDTFYQSKNSGYNVGPYKAVEEFVERHPKYTVLSIGLGLPGMSLLINKRIFRIIKVSL